GFAVHLINASALNEFDRAVRTVNGDADLQVHATTPLGFDETLYPKLARLDGVAGASPVVEVPATIDGKLSLPLLGIEPFRASLVTPNLMGRRVETGAAQPTQSPQQTQTPGQPSTADEAFDEKSVLLSQAALAGLGKSIGDDIDIAAAGKTLPF